MSDAREYGVTMCGEECGGCWVIEGLRGPRWIAGYSFKVPQFCWKCGTRVGIDKRGPWREAMVPRADLEQAQADLAHRDRALKWVVECKRSGRIPSGVSVLASADEWFAAALAATEATPDE